MFKIDIYFFYINSFYILKQDIVTESDQFRCVIFLIWICDSQDRIQHLHLILFVCFFPFGSIEEFIPLLRERMNVLNPYVRQFLVGWITVLDSVPDIDMLGFLPDFLDGNCFS